MSVDALRVVATNGQPTGALPGVNFDFTSIPAINDAGQVAFNSGLVGPGFGPANGSVWRATVDPIDVTAAPAIGLVAAVGQDAPGTNGARFGSLGGSPNVNDDGQITFIAQFTQGGDNVGSTRDTAQYVGAPGNVAIRFREGDAVPGAPAGTLFNDAIFAGGVSRFGDGGVVTQVLGVRGDAKTAINADAIISGTLTLPVFAVSQYSSVEGITPVTTASEGPFSLFTLGSPVTNDDGAIAFTSFLYDESSNQPANFRVMLYRAPGASEFTIAVQPGVPVMGVGPGATLGSPSSPTINGAGQLAFQAMLRDPAGGTGDYGLFTGSPDAGYRIVARNFQDAPGLPGVTVSLSASSPILNAQGQVAFRASLIGAGITSQNNDVAYLWSPVDGSLRQVYREGDVAPGLTPEATFGSLRSSPSLNAAGQVLLYSNIVNFRPGEGYDRGLFATEADGGPLFKVSAAGDTVTLATGQTRVIRSYDLYGGSGGEDGQASSINDAGQIAFLAFFENATNPANASDARAVMVADTMAAPAAAPTGTAAFAVDAPGGPEVRLTFTSAIAADLSASDLTLRDVATGQAIAVSAVVPNGTTAATVRLSAALPDGDYELVVEGATVGDAYGRPLAGGDVRLAFFTLSGDADRDRAVGFSDLLIMARNYGQTGRTFSQGNFDYSADGSVEFGDLLILAQNYNASLFAVRPLPPSSARDRRSDRIAELV